MILYRSFLELLGLTQQNKPKKVTIDWSYPKEISSLLENDEDSLYDSGIYQITTGKKLLYIGMASNGFKTRLEDHTKNWLGSYKGDKKVRFGTIIKPTEVPKTLLEDIEKAIIHETQPLQNSKATQSYNITKHYIITNTGKRGCVPTEISTEKHF